MIKALAFIIALQVAQPLPDPADEARAQALMREIRCVACENEPISQSASDIAEDMRARVRALIADGKSDAEVRGWFSERYGDFVLFRPKAKGFGGMLLWGLPFVLLIGVGGAIALSRRSGTAVIEAVSADHEHVDEG